MEQRMRELVDLLNRYAHAYYVKDAPEVGDGQYDALYDELLALEGQTGTVLADSPSRRVGGEPLSSFAPHRHLARLWSLDKVKTEEEILLWEGRLQKLLSQEGLPAPTYLLEYKIDGLTINLTYDNGDLVQAATRGDGLSGEGILPQVMTIRSVPLRVPFKGKFEVQGEGYMPLSSFEEYNATAAEPLKNARNAAAGALRNLDPKQTQKRRLDAFFYQIGFIEGKTFATASQMRQFLADCGFRVNRNIGSFTSAAEAYRTAIALDDARRHEDYQTDGTVLKVDEMPLREAMGYTDRFPRWAVAIKFEAEEAVTELLDVVWDVGRTGKLTPTAILSPVELGGATVSRATLNNEGDIARKGVKKGGTVWIRRSNDVIPEILGSANDEGVPIEIPTHCPFCHTGLVARGANLFCPNQKTCKPQRLYALSHFVSRDAMDIEGLSEKTLEQAMDALGVITPDGLYDVTVEQWLGLDGFAQRRAQKLYDAIQTSKTQPLDRLILALGIPNVGKRTAQTLALAFGSVKAIADARLEELTALKDVGPIVAESITGFFADEEANKIIAGLFAHGIDPHSQREQPRTDGPLSGERIVFTGTLARLPRAEAQALAQKLGASVSESVTKETTLLVYGEKAGSKLEKAQKLGVRVLAEAEFFLLAGEGKTE
jgi:DNA ligase (NAD+)